MDKKISNILKSYSLRSAAPEDTLSVVNHPDVVKLTKELDKKVEARLRKEQDISRAEEELKAIKDDIKALWEDIDETVSNLFKD